MAVDETLDGDESDHIDESDLKSPHGQPADADVVVREDDDGADVQVSGYLPEVPEQRGRLMLRSAIALTKEHEARHGQTLVGEKLAEIGVSRHKNALLLASDGQHHVVHAPGQVTLRDVDDVVPGVCKH